jgi:transcription initiation factor TFIID subunit 9B
MFINFLIIWIKTLIKKVSYNKDSDSNMLNVIACQVLLELAQNRNKIPLPKSIAGPGFPLPPDQDTLISPNYQFAFANKRSAEPIEETEDEEAMNAEPNPPQEDKTDAQQNPHQRVSFPLPKRQKD